MPQRRAYLDNAATSWPKPDAVYDAVDRYQRTCGAAAGRGAYAQGMEADQLVAAARRGVASLLGASEPRSIVFTLNGTDALNLAIHGLLDGCGSGHNSDPPAHVVTTVVEHNSVLRPLRRLEEAGRISVTRVGCDAAGVVSADEIFAALQPNTRLVALVHASNVTGAIQPVAEVGRRLADHPALFLIDAAQTCGELPFAVDELRADLLAAPGHKGLLGPLGTGFLYVRPGVEQQLQGIRQGGTGSQSEMDRQPDFMPDRFEAGNPNVVGLAGLAAGVRWLETRGVPVIRREAIALIESLLAGLREITGLRIHGPADAETRVGLVSVTLDRYDPQELAATLDAAFGVQVRPGLHCAPLAHTALGTIKRGGTVRFSVGALTTAADVEQAVTAMREIAAASVAL